MYHISVNLAISRREKSSWGTKSSRGGKKAIRGPQKLVSTFFLFLDTSIYVGGAPKNQQGASNGNVTPLCSSGKFYFY